MKVKVEALADKPVTTRFGTKQTFSFKGDDGQWYKTGFKKYGFGVGDEVDFEFNSGRYGNEVTAINSINGGTGPSGPSKGPAPAQRPQFGGPRGVFPIPPTDAQRSIIRQNSLTNALKFCEIGGKTIEKSFDIEFVIKVARQFEAYSAGDMEAAAAKKALQEEEKKDA